MPIPTGTVSAFDFGIAGRFDKWFNGDQEPRRF
jgi:hypothetical protein